MPDASEREAPPYDLSVAVLPFSNLSGDPADEHICDGVASDVVSNLSRFRELVVIARHSSFLFRGQSLEDGSVGQRLGARYPRLRWVAAFRPQGAGSHPTARGG